MMRASLIRVSIYNGIHIRQHRTFSNQKLNDERDVKSYKALPGPSRYNLLRDFIPGGKCHNYDFHDAFSLYRKHYGEIFKIPGLFGKRDIVVIFDPKDFEKVFRTEGTWPMRNVIESVIHYRRKVRPEVFVTGGLGIEQGKPWSDFRTTVNPIMMQPKTVKLYIPAVNNTVDQLIERMKKIRNPSTLELPANFESELNRWALESICLMALDTQLGLIGNLNKNSEEEIFIKAIKTFFHLIHELDMKPSMWQWIRTPKFYRMMSAGNIITDFSIKQIEKVKERLERASKDPAANNTSNFMEKGVLEKMLLIDPKIAVINALDMITAGVDSTSSGFTSVVYNLAKNPEKQAILRKELIQKLPKKSSPLTPQNMAHLPYLRACIKEAFRCIPVVSSNFRDAGEDIVLRGYRIPKGTGIAMEFATIQKEDRYFEKANEFLPERFLKQKTNSEQCPFPASPDAFTFLPFGFGPRMCIGRRFAELELEVSVAKIIRNFHVEWLQPDLKFRASAFNTPIGDLKFKITDV